MTDKPRVRFAPSPTGYLHIGGARTALFNYLHARRHGGVYLLRIEDTDLERSTPEAVEAIFDGLKFLGLYPPDEKAVFQTECVERHKELINQLLKEGKAYRCVCSPERLTEMREKAMAEKRKVKYDGACRDLNLPIDGPGVVRFCAQTEGVTVWQDKIQGRISYENVEFDDFIIARADGSPTYNFSVVADDHDMNVTLVLRGADHMSNTPRQIQIYQAFGWELPEFAHMPLLHAPDGSKISKRHGAVGVTTYRDAGFLPEAINNYLARIGWSHGDQEFFTKEELIELFDAADINNSPGVFDISLNPDGSTKMPEKLLWVNSQHLMKKSVEELRELVAPFLEKAGYQVTAEKEAGLLLLLEQLKARSKTLVEMAAALKFYFVDEIIPDEKPAKKFLKPEIVEAMNLFIERFAEKDAWGEEDFEALLHGICEALDIKMKNIAQAVRISITGGTASPPLTALFAALTKDESLARLRAGAAHAAENTGE